MPAEYLVEGPPEFYHVRKQSLSRQRVTARSRPDDKTMQPKITTGGAFAMLMLWLKRWLPWYPTPEGGCL